MGLNLFTNIIYSTVSESSDILIKRTIKGMVIFDTPPQTVLYSNLAEQIRLNWGMPHKAL